MVNQALDIQLAKFREWYGSNPENRKTIKELAKAIEGGFVESSSVSPLHIVGAGLGGLAAIISMEGCAVIQVPQIVYPAGAPRVISDYGDRINAKGQERSAGPHSGIDIEGLFGNAYGGIGQAILAAADGVVFRSHWSDFAGYRIVIEHGRDMDGNYLRTVYFHNSENLVNEGQKVKGGQQIAKIGATGSGITSGFPHVHFAVYRGPTKEYSKEWRDVNPHDYWVDGPYKITCFDSKKEYPKSPIRFTYPVECKR